MIVFWLILQDKDMMKFYEDKLEISNHYFFCQLAVRLKISQTDWDVISQRHLKNVGLLAILDSH